MKDANASSGTVWRPGSVSEKKKDHKHKKRPCASAPSTPTNVSLVFRKRNEHHDTVWRGVVRFDPIDTDVAGRALEPEIYEAELQAVDVSGDPVETHGQEESTTANGSDFAVHSGSATVVGKAIRLEAPNAVVKQNLTGLTTGIDAGVDFYIRKDAPQSSPNVKCEIRDLTTSTTVSQKNVTPDSIKPKLVATRSVTPESGHSYEARVTFLGPTDPGTGKPILQAAQWHDRGDSAVWRERIAGDADVMKISFPDLAKPKVWYYQARIRAMNRIRGARCWSAWSAWTPATNPVTGDPIGPPAPDGLTLTFHREEARKRSPFQAKAQWNELPWWIPPDGEPVEGADRYAVRLAISENGGASTLRTRRVALQAKDDDADQTAFYEFNNIRRRRHYRFSVRAFKDDRRGAWSNWSSWKSPKADIGNGPNGPINVDKTKVKPGVILATWDEPNNPEDVDYYRVRVYNQGNLRETRKTRGTHYKYIIPDNDRGTAHNFKVTAIDEDNNESLEVDTGQAVDDTDAAGPGGEGFDVGDIRKLAGPIAGWLTRHPKWLRCNGNLYPVASYPDLFSEIGYTFGGSGASFAVPDHRGKKALGVDDSGYGSTVGEGGGDKDHDHNHNHGNHDHGHQHGSGHGHGHRHDAGTGSHDHFIGQGQTGSAGGTQINAVGGGANDASRMAHTHSVNAHNTNFGGVHQHVEDTTTGAVPFDAQSGAPANDVTKNKGPYLAVHFVIKALP